MTLEKGLLLVPDQCQSACINSNLSSFVTDAKSKRALSCDEKNVDDLVSHRASERSAQSTCSLQEDGFTKRDERTNETLWKLT